MAIYNTSYDAANTAVRAFLTKVGEYYWGRSFNTGSGSTKKVWEDIKTNIFNSQCAYCGERSPSLQIEHIVMFNREQFGLHHPGNIIPVCNHCNRRRKDVDKNYLSWEKHLEEICRERAELNCFFSRRDKIKAHMNSGTYMYPQLTDAEKHSIRVIANTLYENIKSESEKALKLYAELDKAFVKQRD